MKVIIKEKSEGRVVVEFAADSPFEAMLMSTVPPDTSTVATIEGKSSVHFIGLSKPGADAAGYAPKATVLFGAFIVDAHEMVQP